MAQFLRYALACLEEAKRRFRDGIQRGYFSGATCAEALTFGDRCGAATMALWKTVSGFADEQRRGVLAPALQSALGADL